jgi:membrane fusion protein (multidrug efflux system)
MPSAAVLLLLVGLALIAGCSKPVQGGGGPPQFPPPDVSTAPVQQKDVPIYGEWVANLDGYTNAQIQPQVTGYLIRQDYKEGSEVRKGQILYEIDPRPFQAALDQANGQLAQAKANLQLAQINTNVIHPWRRRMPSPARNWTTTCRRKLQTKPR